MNILSNRKSPDECLLDMDGVFVGFFEGVNRFFNISANVIEAMPRPIQYYWMLDPVVPGLTKKDFLAKIDFPEFWENLPWTPDGQGIIELMEFYFGFDNICILTNPSGMESARIGKARWLKKNLPRYYEADHFLMGSKKGFCAGGDHKLLLDDSDENVQLFQEKRGVGLVVPRIWNSKYRDADSVVEHISYALG